MATVGVGVGDLWGTDDQGPIKTHQTTTSTAAAGSQPSLPPFMHATPMICQMDTAPYAPASIVITDTLTPPPREILTRHVVASQPDGRWLRLFISSPIGGPTAFGIRGHVGPLSARWPGQAAPCGNTGGGRGTPPS